MLGLVLAALLATATAPSPAPAALSRAQAMYADGAAHAAKFVQSYVPSGFTNAKTESGELWVQGPTNLRFEYTRPEPKIFTFDGQEGRLYVPSDRQLTVAKIAEADRQTLPVLLLTDPEKFAREYAVSSATGTEAADVLLFQPRTPRQELTRLRLAVSPDGSVPQLSYEDASGNRTEFKFEAWRREKARPPASYRVTGPPGTRVLEN
jgi:outer membrane lipoprotein carrier protein